ncbi:hypothetical protein I6A60_04310 [Frankia sp. AgB1.9]|uniref:cupredoxin domain-containing protein n=1 Tax=unclassified Frankia TaxID=2632575 RepID=UPI001932BBBC|nr:MULTISPECIES: plastocyanin/azurin family copper-binding protein [unclassified Frankia]MBL7490217.1 hypothetical protein [Frankia sp. AgW1.1]MBL7547107.1 hypothetical protein [Frankia sp. AgB1.9]MBL7619397.1 hypothetical protein [Frankia sp. AgB1.8]
MRRVRLAAIISGLVMAGGTVAAMATPAAASSAPGAAGLGAATSSASQADWDWNWPWPDKEKRKVGRNHLVTIPGEDRFTPFGLTIRAGDSVTWRNEDTDNHTVVTDDAFTTTDNLGVNHLILGTDDNNGKPGLFTLTFRKPGNFVYYCRFHSHLDQFNQPVAPGPDGGIQDASGNFGTPMMGVITVLPAGRSAN